MEAGTDVWVRDEDSVWAAGTVIRKEMTEDVCALVVSVEAEEGNQEHVIMMTDGDIKARNKPSTDDADDLTVLQHLHEPAILHTLQVRYQRDLIYTSTGPMLIAVNPFRHVDLYNDELLQAYKEYGHMIVQGQITPTLPPHLFSVADAAYRNMLRAVHASTPVGPADQCILIGGESGAGKTESTKIVMKYLTRVHEKSNPRSAAHQNTLMQRLLDSNPILEAFGNAQTLRNNNSSRFGKYIEMHFDIRGSLVGASIQTYLLEKVRVVSHSTGERAFHIFHQLLAGASDSDKCLWRLDDVDRFRYVHQSSTIAQDDVTASEYMQTRMAINTLQFSESNVQDLFSCMAGLLHLGNVEFESAGEGSFLNNVSLKSATNAAELFGVNAQDLIRQLTIRVVETSKDRVEAPRSPSHAADARDTLAKILYSTLFDFIVRQLNNSVAGGADQAVSTIGVLDIFGFECFAVNSLEQLCINYTNEALQQQFNEFMFKSEQEEYEREQIDFRFVSFPDNTLCLQLIEDRTTGILSILHDQCFIPQPSDEKFVARLYKENATNPYFGATSTQKTNLCFSVKHYAGVVEYTSDQFVEKNRDLLPKESRKLFASSSLSAVNSLFAEFNTIEIPIAGRGGGRGKTVVIQFKDSLRDLMNKIGNTKPHYVRCIKPNDQNVASMFNRRRVCEQLRYGGVLQAVAIARSGFPVKFSHESFYTQYRIILSMKDLSLCHLNEDILPFHIPCGYTKIWDKCLRLISALVHVSSVTPTVRRMAHEELQLGTTKVFLRNKAHELLEAWAARRRFTAATLIQARVRGRVEWRKYLGYSAARRIQKLFKRWIVRLWIFKGNAAIRIQTCYRRHLAIKRFRLRVFAVRTLQRLHRRRSMSKLAAVVPDYNAAALIIQLRFRRRLAVKRIQQRRASRLAQPPHSEVTSSANQSTVCLGDIADFKDSKEVEYPLAGSSPRFSETKEAEQDTTTSVSTCSFPERPMLRTQHSLNLSQSYINMSSECSVRELTRIMSGQALLEESQTCTGIMQQLNSISGPDEAIEACKSLILLTGRSMPHRTMLGASGACTAVVNILRNYTENRHVVLQAVWAIRNLSVHQMQNKTALGTAGACYLLITVLETHCYDAEICELACKALFTLCLEHYKNTESVLNTDVFKILTRVLLFHSQTSGGLCKQAVRVVGLLIRADTSRQLLDTDSDFSEVDERLLPIDLARELAVVLETHLDDPRVISDCCWAIRHASMRSQGNVTVLRSVKVCSKLVKVLNAHKKHRCVCEEGIYSLALLGVLDNHTIPILQHYSIMIILEVLRLHIESPLVAVYACICVRRALQASAESAVNLLKTQACEIMVRATFKHADAAVAAVPEACVLVIGNMCARRGTVDNFADYDCSATDRAIREAFRACNCAQALTRVLEAHPENYQLCAYTLWSMRRFAAHVKENKKALAAAGLGKLLVGVMQCFSGQVERSTILLEHAVALTLAVMDKGGKALRARFVEEGIVRALIFVLEAHPTNELIAECVVRSIATLLPKRKFTLHRGLKKGLLVDQSAHTAEVIERALSTHVTPPWKATAEAVLRALR